MQQLLDAVMLRVFGLLALVFGLAALVWDSTLAHTVGQKWDE